MPGPVSDKALKPLPYLARNWKFESTPLQRRVCKPSVPQRPESINAGVVIGIVCFLGLTALLLAVIPLVAILPILLFIGLIIGAQAFQATPARRPPAIILAILPNVAAWAKTLIDGVLGAVGTSAERPRPRWSSRSASVPCRAGLPSV